jgi:hypothetical protein
MFADCQGFPDTSPLHSERSASRLSAPTGDSVGDTEYGWSAGLRTRAHGGVSPGTVTGEVKPLALQGHLLGQDDAEGGAPGGV